MNIDMTTDEILRLRIGSIVLGEEYIYNEDTDTEEYHYHPARICGIDETSSIYIDGHECMYNIEWLDDYDGENCDALRPMPLTQEFLCMNGFSKELYSTFKTDSVEVEVCLDADLPMYVFTKSWRYSLPYPNSVHELQDALCVCGLSELAFKLKVNK